MLTFDEFKDSLNNNNPPAGLAPHVEALWHDAKGDWEKAHSLIDHLGDAESSHVHAYLHRKEGDIWNADYWYRKAGKKRPDFNLAEEWDQLLLAALQ